jgi:hypothetical protein
MSFKIKEFLHGWSGSAYGTYNSTMRHSVQNEVFGKNLCAETVKVSHTNGKIETIPFKYFGV